MKFKPVSGVTVNINAVNDGINVNYDVTLLSGNFTIAAGDDAIHADHILTIGSEDGEGPTIKVTSSNEGLEGTVVNIYGGDISIVSSDDAINAANGDGLYEGVLDYSFNMMGGRLVINSQGDGIDSNGNVNLMGGSAEIHSGSQGGEAGIDYDGQLYVSDDFQLNNQSGTAGPDGMGGMPGDMSGAPGQMDGQNFGGQQPGQMDGQSFSGQQPTGGMPGQP
ncbi:MAG: carbohydrate-binding domain-containing protein [Clostridia bacterium]|nr:carbohydrate-binding domain-containing protein [Clostridia bacterium]